MIKTFTQFQESSNTVGQGLSYAKQREIEAEYKKDQELEQRCTGYKSNSKQPKAKGIWFYIVPRDKEDLAKAYGLTKTKTGKWGLTQYDTSGRTFMLKKESSDKAFGEGNWFKFTPKQANQYEDEDAYINKMAQEYDTAYEKD